MADSSRRRCLPLSQMSHCTKVNKEFPYSGRIKTQSGGAQYARPYPLTLDGTAGMQYVRPFEMRYRSEARRLLVRWRIRPEGGVLVPVQGVGFNARKIVPIDVRWKDKSRGAIRVVMVGRSGQREEVSMLFPDLTESALRRESVLFFQ